MTSNSASAVYGSSTQLGMNVVLLSPLIRDSNGEAVVLATIGQEVSVSTRLHNNSTAAKDAVVIIELRDEEGVTQGLKWQKVTLQADSYKEISTSWTPEKKGSIEIRSIAVSDLESPLVLSPLVVSKAGAATFSLHFDHIEGFEGIDTESLQRMETAVARYYAVESEPFQDVTYDSVVVDLVYLGGQFHNERDSYLISSNATAKVAGVQANETYVFRLGYNEVDGAFNVQRIHSTKYLQANVTTKALGIAQKEPVVMEFFSRFENSTDQSVLPGATYLDSFEVQYWKYAATGGGSHVTRPEYEFLPDTGQVIVVFFNLLPDAVIEDPECCGTIEMPNAAVYLDPASLEVLGASKLFWD